MAKKEIQKTERVSENIGNENLEKLRKIFPQFVKDGEVDFDALKAFFARPEHDRGDKEDITAGTEKYGLNWAGKSNAFRAIRVPSTGTLTPQLKESKDFDKTGNIFIEGDNLEALKLLQKRYRGQIKMIYIDPPYNTGKDFIYKDNFTENISDYYERTGQSEDGIKLTSNPESNGRYHSDWLTMMYPRLFLARNLLRDDGVMFISIDDNEVHNLRMIMDEIFGEENFVACISVVGNPRGRDYGGVARMHDYILIYVKSEETEIHDLYEPEKVFPYEDKKSGFEIRELRNRNIAFHIGNRPNLYYPFYVNPKNKDENGFFEISLENHNGWIEVNPKESQGYKTVWRWGRQKSSEYLNTEIAAKEMEDGGFQIIEKYRKKTKMARSVWWNKEDNTEKGTLLVKSLFNKKVFDFPKPIEIIRKMLEMGTRNDSNDIVLDFFAGSGTTAHAVMAQNAEDGGNRKWICVQLPEATDEDGEAYKAGYKTIAEISRERIRRAAWNIFIRKTATLKEVDELVKRNEKIKTEMDKKFEQYLKERNLGFKSFVLEKSNYRQWNVLTDKDDEKKLKEQMKLFAEKPLMDKYDEKSVVYEIILKEGFDLNAEVSQIVIPAKAGIQCWIVTEGDPSTSSGQARKIIITFAKEISKEQVENLGLSENDIFICLDSALDDTTKVNIMKNLIVRVI